MLFKLSNQHRKIFSHLFFLLRKKNCSCGFFLTTIHHCEEKKRQQNFFWQKQKTQHSKFSKFSHSSSSVCLQANGRTQSVWNPHLYPRQYCELSFPSSQKAPVRPITPPPRAPASPPTVHPATHCSHCGGMSPHKISHLAWRVVGCWGAGCGRGIGRNVGGVGVWGRGAELGGGEQFSPSLNC